MEPTLFTFKCKGCLCKAHAYLSIPYLRFCNKCVTLENKDVLRVLFSIPQIFDTMYTHYMTTTNMKLWSELVKKKMKKRIK